MPSPKVLIVGEFSFPSGCAAAVRVRSYARGFVKSGCKVGAVPFGGCCGQAELVPEYVKVYTSRKFSWGLRNKTIGSKLRWFFTSYIQSFLCLWSYLNNSDRKSNEVLLLYGRSFVKLIPWFIYGKLTGSKICLDVVESQNSFCGKFGRLNPIYWDWWFWRMMFPHLDLVICISHALYQDACERGVALAMIVPAIGEVKVIHRERKSVFPVRLLYVGAFFLKDAPSVMTEAFTMLKKTGESFIFMVAGRYMEHDDGRAVVAKLKNELTLGENLELYESPPDEVLGKLIESADILLLPRRDDLVELCSFPTRIIEFLQSGNVVAMTEWGDIGNYFENGLNCILFAPGDPKSMSDSLRPYVRDPSKLLTLKVSNEKVLDSQFNEAKHCRLVLENVLGRKSC